MRFARFLILSLLLAATSGAPPAKNSPTRYFIWNIPAGVQGSVWQAEELPKWRWTPETLGNDGWTWKRFVSGPTSITFFVNSGVSQRFFVFIPEPQFCCPLERVFDPVAWTWNDYYD